MPRVLVFNGTEPSTLIVVVVLCLAMVVVAYGNFHERRRGDRIENELAQALRLHRSDAVRIRTNATTIADLHARILQLEDCIRDSACEQVPTTIPPAHTTTTQHTRTTTTTRPRRTSTTRPTTRPTTTTTKAICPNPTAPVVTVCPTVP